MRFSGLLLSMTIAVAALACGGDGGSGNNGLPDSIFDPKDNNSLDKNSDGSPTTDKVSPGDDSNNGDSSGDPDSSEPIDVQPAYKSPELGVRIMWPGSNGWAQLAGGATAVGGIIMGEPDFVTWSSDKGPSGTADGIPFFTTSKVDLVPGDNTITVTATKAGVSVADSITVTYNPAFQFGGDLKVVPNGFFTNQSTVLRFALFISGFGSFNTETLTLCECTPTGMCIKPIHVMVDDGDTETSGDEVAEDSVYSWKETFMRTDPGRLCFRAHIQVSGGTAPYEAYSPVTCVDVVRHLSKAECVATQNILKDARTKYANAVAEIGHSGATQLTIDHLKTLSAVAESGPASDGGRGVWMRFQNGTLGAIDVSQAGQRSGAWATNESLEAPIESVVNIRSKHAAVLAPFKSQLGQTDESAEVQAMLAASSCPPYEVANVYADSHASLATWRSLSDNGVVAITSHGEAYFRDLNPQIKAGFGWHHMGSQEVLWSGEAVDCELMYQGNDSCSGPNTCPAGSECIITEYVGDGLTGSGVNGICVDFKQLDLMRGNLVMGADRYGVLPSHVEEYRGDGFPASLVYIGACRSIWNGTMAMALYASGARAIVGYTNTVSSEFAHEQGLAFFKKMIQDQFVASAAMPESWVEDPANPGSRLVLIGTTSLGISDSNVINAGFELGDLTGWAKDGDARVVSRLGETNASDGKFMLLMSTGMGYTQQTGSIEQRFCIPDNIDTLRLYWKLYSEEFKEFCGTEYMDTFEARIENDDGQITLVDTWIDALCPVGECIGCGSQFVGLAQSDVSFDQGDVWNIEWQIVERDITALAGQGPVTLRFFTGDVGDSIYDTAVLVDAVVFE